MQLHRIPTDEEYLNDFHKKWNEACMRSNEQMQSMHYSAEYLREQSKWLHEQYESEKEEKRKKRNKKSALDKL